MNNEVKEKKNAEVAADSAQRQRPLIETEAAAYLRIAPRTLRDYRLKGLVSWVRIGKRPLYKIEDLDAFLDRSTFRAEEKVA